MPGAVTRAVWKPPIPLAFFVFTCANSVMYGVTVMRACALGIIGLWLGMAIYDWLSKGRLLRWMYSDDA